MHKKALAHSRSRALYARHAHAKQLLAFCVFPTGKYANIPTSMKCQGSPAPEDIQDSTHPPHNGPVAHLADILQVFDWSITANVKKPMKTLLRITKMGFGESVLKCYCQ